MSTILGAGFGWLMDGPRETTAAGDVSLWARDDGGFANRANRSIEEKQKSRIIIKFQAKSKFVTPTILFIADAMITIAFAGTSSTIRKC